MDNEKVIDHLNELIETCKDGQEGFRQAAENVKSAELKSFFIDESLIRSRMAGDLQAEVIRLGGDPDKQGTVAGALHRTWVDLKKHIGAVDQSILSSVETGEDAAVKSFEKALKEDLPRHLLDLIQQQYENIKGVHDRVRMLRDSEQYNTKTA